ncbi:predicted protein [Arabidopsis lyrata subsp. lyrata]|uniref:Predicted protein n=1 Tax=Arabidopsis lyrata subsp. lyrata TaxID=81972 RepID=D7MHD1_ARALL|nr:predicted protein [Arabidopsis lyrata subsp. lyrata]
MAQIVLDQIGSCMPFKKRSTQTKWRTYTDNKEKRGTACANQTVRDHEILGAELRMRSHVHFEKKDCQKSPSLCFHRIVSCQAGQWRWRRYRDDKVSYKSVILPFARLMLHFSLFTTCDKSILVNTKM